MHIPARIPARILRESADDLPISRARRPSTTRELERRDFILAAGQHLFARFGRAALTLGNVALGLRMSPATFRKHFCDLDDLLGEILRRHLRALAAAIGEVPREHPDRRRAQRAAYLAATRCGMGGHTELHRILLRDRHGLPPDLAEQIDTLHFGLGECLAGDHAAAALALLDTAYLFAPQIEPMLAALAATEAAADAASTAQLQPTAAAPKVPTALPEAASPSADPAWRIPRERPRSQQAGKPPAHVPTWLNQAKQARRARAGP